MGSVSHTAWAMYLYSRYMFKEKSDKAKLDWTKAKRRGPAKRDKNHEGFFLIVSAQMQSENKIYGMWKIYNCKTFFSFLSAFCLVEHSVLRHTWRVRSFSRAQLKTYLHIAYISNPTLLLLLLLLLMTLCRVFTITYLKQTIYLVYVVLQLFCIYNYIPETNHISSVCSVAAVLYLQYILHGITHVKKCFVLLR